MPRDKTFFILQEELLELDCVKNYLSTHPNLEICGLLSVSQGVIRVFFYKTNEETNNKYMTSELIEY